MSFPDAQTLVRRACICVVGFAWCLGPVAAARAQDSRAAGIAQKQAEKAGRLAPPTPSRAERIFTNVTSGFAQLQSGLYPTLDSIYGGGGFTLGAGYRHVFGDNNVWNVRGLYSIKNYKLIDFSVAGNDLARGKVDLLATAGWRDATQVGFYGIGMQSDADDRTHFRFKQTFAGASATLTPARAFFVRAGATFEDFQLEEGQGSRPSIEERFTAAQAPGLDADPAFLHTLVSTGVDSRPAAGYARKGSLLSVSYHNYFDTDDTYSFDRMDAELVQHVPILRENWVLSLRGRVQTTLSDEDVVPFFLLPALGSGSTLRAYRSWRFRDRHSLLLQGEWRWIPNRQGLDMAIFVDAGKVTSRRSDLDFDGLKTDVGLGVRFHSPVSTPLRVELAKGGEGWHLVFSGSAAF